MTQFYFILFYFFGSGGWRQGGGGLYSMDACLLMSDITGFPVGIDLSSLRALFLEL